MNQPVLTRFPAVYFLPIWFQAVKGDSAVESGIHLLPMVLSLVVLSILTGVGTSATGYYMPFLIFGICVCAVGAGLLTTLHVNTSVGAWIGYQIVYGAGLGCCFQAPNMAAQTVLPRREVSIGASLMLFAQTLFGAIFVSVGQNILDSGLAGRVSDIVSVTPAQIDQAGITGLYGMVPVALHGQVLEAYNSSLRTDFVAALVLACITIFGGLGMEWLSVKRGRRQERGPVGDVEAVIPIQDEKQQ